MTDYDASGWERVPFGGRPANITGRSRSPLIGHGWGCSANPEIGCVCGEDERQSARLEAREERA